MESEASVLIVDDVAENVQILGNILRKQGYNVLASLDGEKALNIINERAIDLILLDISMPDMDGYEVIQRVKENPENKDIPVVFLTARTQTADLVKGFRLGAADYITKPFQAEELLARVRNHLLIKQQQEQIAGQNADLQELNAVKDRLFGIIAHDLRNPFNLVINYADLLLRNISKYDKEKQAQFLRSIYSSGKKAYNLLENLLTWSHAQIGSVNYDPVKVNMQLIVHETITFLSDSAQQKNIQIENLVPDNFAVYADENMMHIVLRNLLSNAIKFTPKEGRIAVEAKMDDSAGRAQIAVVDSGMGIPAEKQEKLFNIDNKHSTPGTENEEGTGLGLVLCKEFVEKNGGSIWVESQPGNGSKFNFTLPPYNGTH